LAANSAEEQENVCVARQRGKLAAPFHCLWALGRRALQTCALAKWLARKLPGWAGKRQQPRGLGAGSESRTWRRLNLGHAVSVGAGRSYRQRNAAATNKRMPPFSPDRRDCSRPSE